MSDTSRPPSPRIEPEIVPSSALAPQPRIETDDEEPIRLARNAAGQAARVEAETQPPQAPFAEPNRPAPRIEQEAGSATRLALTTPETPDEIAGAPDPGWGMPALVLGGFSVLALGLAGLQTGNFVAEQFHRAAVLGWTTLLVAVVGFGLVLAGIWRELRAVMRLRSVDRLRAALAGSDAVARVAAARHWLGMVENGAALRPALDALNDPDAVLPLLRAGVETRLRREADALGRRAAMGVVAGMAATPAPSLVVLLVSWRGLRLIRQVATLYGMRPGLLGTLGLLRRTAGAATATAVTEVAINSAAHAILSTPLLSHLAGEMAGGAVAARRMVVLGRAAALACTPLPPE